MLDLQMGGFLLIFRIIYLKKLVQKFFFLDIIVANYKTTTIDTT